MRSPDRGLRAAGGWRLRQISRTLARPTGRARDGAIDRFRAEIRVGITGVAGPGGGTKRKPVGYVCVCVKLADGPVLARDPVIPGDRGEIRDRSCTLALHLLRRLLRGEELPA